MHVEVELAKIAEVRDATLNLEQLTTAAAEPYRVVAKAASHLLAYVMLMVASRAPAKATRDRTQLFERIIENEAGLRPAGTARLRPRVRP